MKMNLRLGAWLAAVLLALVAGCATARVDWNTRVGVFTYDPAVQERGPPDKQAKLSNGETVSEWVTRHYADNRNFIVGGGVGYGYGGTGYVQGIRSTTYENTLG